MLNLTFGSKSILKELKKRVQFAPIKKRYKRKYILTQRRKIPVRVRFDDKEFTSRYKRVALRSLPNVI